MIPKKRLKSEIENVVHREIHSGTITNVSVSEGTGADGDEIILVHVVFDNKGKLLNAHETLSATREIHDRLEAIGEKRFPVLYYIAKSEAGKLAEAG